MKKLLLLLFFVFPQFVFCVDRNNSNFDAEYNKLLELLSKEKWTKTESLSRKLIDDTEGNDSLNQAHQVLNYIYIYSVAGMMNERKITQEEALQKVQFLKSKRMQMPAHPYLADSYVNCTKINEEYKNEFFTGVNNPEGTQIFSFEYVEIKDGIKDSPKDLEGKMIVQIGDLTDIAVEGYAYPRFKLHFKNGEYHILPAE